jgi:hypothetical protein
MRVMETSNDKGARITVTVKQTGSNGWYYTKVETLCHKDLKGVEGIDWIHGAHTNSSAEAQKLMTSGEAEITVVLDDKSGSLSVRRVTWPRLQVGHLLPEKYRGVRWLRGHHADESPEVKALLAAYALTRKS